MNIYDFIVKDMYGNDVSLKKYAGKVLLIVNTATRCGFTSQYKDLQSLYDKYQSKGLEILDFPCNQFNNQTPESENEIKSFCEINFNITFPQFKKIDVNGKNESDLYKYLKNEKGSIFGKDIKWNFTKFLVDRNGKVVKRFSSMINPLKIEESLKSLL